MRRRIGVSAVVLVSACLAAAPALAAKGGDPNAGDVWVDNVGQPAGPGHEMDPHLSCTNIVLYGAKLADSSGSFTIDGWPPSGSKSVDYSGTWAVQSGTQQIALIPIADLLAGAQHNGDSPSNQGYHFKLDFSQDPQKHKTFWVNCPASSGGGTPGGGTPGGGTPGGGTPGGGTPGGGTPGGGTPGGGTPGTSGTSSTPTTVAGGTTTTSTGSGKPLASVKAVHKKRKKKKLAKPKRHVRVKHRRVRARIITRSPSFTG